MRRISKLDLYGKNDGELASLKAEFENAIGAAEEQSREATRSCRIFAMSAAVKGNPSRRRHRLSHSCCHQVHDAVHLATIGETVLWIEDEKNGSGSVEPEFMETSFGKAYRGNMQRISMTLTFSDDDGASRNFSASVETAYPGDSAGEDHVAHMLLTELKIDVGPQGLPQHNAAARAWLVFPNRPAGWESYFDIENSQALWRELATLIMGAEGDLILAAAYKAQEPEQEPPIRGQRWHQSSLLHSRQENDSAQSGGLCADQGAGSCQPAVARESGGRSG